ncbi:MAG: acyl-CoA dehydrogenase family protein [Candidatus Tectimicrobiota bacterium]
MDFTLTTTQHELLAKATWLARECLAPRAAQYDTTGRHPRESWHDLWQHGFLSIAVPAAYGGGDLDMLTYVMVLERLTQGCTNTTMTLHMHSVVQRYIEALASPAQKAAYYPEVVEQGKLFGSWGSEPERRGGSGVSETTIAPHGAGYMIRGRKHFCTMAGGAHRYLVHCAMVQGAGSAGGLQMALVPHDAPGLQVTSEWNTLGMRATVSPSVTFEDCYVSQDALLGTPGQPATVGVSQGFGLGYAAIYIGAAQRALDFTIAYCQEHQFEPEPVPLAHSVVVQRHVAEMSLALEGARLVLYQSASQWASASPSQRAVLAARAKYLATEAALAVTSRAHQTVGGRSVYCSYPLEQLFRDVRTSTMMPPNLDKAMEIVGKAALGLEEQGQLWHFAP